MTVAFRIVYLISLGAIIVLWFLDFDPASVFRGTRPSQDDPAIASRLAVLEARIGAVEQSAGQPPTQAPSAGVSDTSLQTIEGQIAALDTRLTELARRPMPPAFDPAALEAWIKGLEGEIARLATRPAPGFDPGPLEARIAELADKVDSLAAREVSAAPTPFDASPIEARLAELADRVDALSRRPLPQVPPPFDAGPLTNRIDRLADRVEALSRRVEQERDAEFDPRPLEARIDALSEQVADLTARPQPTAPDPFDPQPLEERVDALAAQVAAIPPPQPFDPEPLIARIDSLTERIDLLAARPVPKPTPAFDPAPLEQRIEDLARSVEAIEVPPAFDPSGLSERIEELRAEVDAETDGLLAASGQLAAQVAALEDRVGELAQRPPPEPSPPFDPSDLEARIGALETAVASRQAQEAIADLAAQVAELEEQVAALGESAIPAPSEPAESAEPQEPTTGSPPTEGSVALVATEEAWIRLRDGGRLIFEGLLPAGSRFEIPPDLENPNLRAGNGVKVFMVVGDKAYGPVGPRPRLVKNIPVDPAEITARYPEADIGEVGR